VETGRVEAKEAWWFTGDRWDPVERRPTTLELIEMTERWIQAGVEVKEDL
jgi:hypothetical protein